MDTSNGNVRMIDDELMQQIEAASGRSEMLKQIEANLLTPQKRHQLMRTGRTKVGRNDPCPCGSMKEDGSARLKFKKCCLNTKPYQFSVDNV